MERSARLTMRIRPEMDLALDVAAAANDARVTWLVENILTEWLVAHGYMQPKELR